jgi:hypothetical protein
MSGITPPAFDLKHSATLFVDGIRTTRTQNRVAFGELDDPIIIAFRAPLLAGFYDAIFHGYQSGQHAGLWQPGSEVPLRVDVEQIARLVEAQPDYHGQPVRLVSCWMGRRPDGLASQLAVRLCTPVLAATAEIFPHPWGQLRLIDGFWRLFEAPAIASGANEDRVD